MEIILVLGGNRSRNKKGAELAKIYPNSKVVISSEIGDHGLPFYEEAGIDNDRIVVDMQAWDTVTNFTHTYKLLKRLSATKLHVVTDAFHMPRSLAIAEEVWGGRIPIEGHDSSSDIAGLKDDVKFLYSDSLRAKLWRKLGILIYWKSVYEARKELFKQTESHSLIEIGI